MSIFYRWHLVFHTILLLFHIINLTWLHAYLSLCLHSNASRHTQYHDKLLTAQVFTGQQAICSDEFEAFKFYSIHVLVLIASTCIKFISADINQHHSSKFKATSCQLSNWHYRLTKDTLKIHFLMMKHGNMSIDGYMFSTRSLSVL